LRLYKRKKDGTDPWWFASHHRGRPFRRSAGTEDKQAAQEYADQFRGELWRTQRLGERPAITWDVATLEWLGANAHLRAGGPNKTKPRNSSQRFRNISPPKQHSRLATGLRRANVSQLEWTNVDMRRRVAWIDADQARGARTIPSH
jgi:hypothetical protein